MSLFAYVSLYNMTQSSSFFYFVYIWLSLYLFVCSIMCLSSCWFNYLRFLLFLCLSCVLFPSSQLGASPRRVLHLASQHDLTTLPNETHITLIVRVPVSLFLPVSHFIFISHPFFSRFIFIYPSILLYVQLLFIYPALFSYFVRLSRFIFSSPIRLSRFTFIFHRYIPLYVHVSSVPPIAVSCSKPSCCCLLASRCSVSLPARGKRRNSLQYKRRNM